MNSFKSILRSAVFTTLLGLVVFMPALALAQSSEPLPFDPQEAAGSKNTKTIDRNNPSGVKNGITSIKFIEANLGSADPLSVTLTLINVGLSLLATGFLILLLYAGFLWLTARGNSDQVTKAQTYLIRGGVGFVLILGSLGFSITVFTIIDNAANPQATPTP